MLYKLQASSKELKTDIFSRKEPVQLTDPEQALPL
jgi:hypothetical protein